MASDKRRISSVVLALALGALVIAGLIEVERRGGPPASPASTLNLPWLEVAGIARAKAFREPAGLRVDDAWLRFVATDSVALGNVHVFGIPMTTAEIEELERRAQTTNELIGVAQRFGTDHPDAWAGVYVEDGVVVVRLVDSTGSVETELRRHVTPGAPLEVVPATWSQAELTALRDKVAEDPWLREHFHLLGAGVSVRDNTVSLEVSSSDSSAPAAIESHFAAGDRLTVSIDGTGVRSLPTGSIHGRAVDANGTAVPGLWLRLTGDVVGAGLSGDVAIGSGPTGEFLAEGVPATGYEVQLFSDVDRAGNAAKDPAGILVGSARVEVTAGKTVDVTIAVAWP